MTETTPQEPDEQAVRDLEAVLAATEDIVEGAAHDQARLPTPCPGFDVGQLVDHVLGWSASYAARLGGTEEPGDPAQHRAGPDPRTELHGYATTIVAGYRDGSPGAQQLPVGIVLMDYLTHGWDLAVATGRPAPYPDEAAERALAAGRQMLTPENRGTSFGPEVEAPAGASPLERLVAFLGRDPAWRAD